MIIWREKLLATLVHFGATLVLAAIAAALIFFVWFPHPFEAMIGGTELFMLVVGCDLALGPLLSLVVYDSRKSRSKLVFDYAVIGGLQIAALVYGVFVVAGTRPVYVAFNTDRFEIVAARDISEKELAAARDPRYAKLPWSGPRLIAINVPKADQQDALFQSVSGIEEHQRPKFYSPLESKLAAIDAKARPLSQLEARKPGSKALLSKAVANAGIPAERLRWLPVRHREGFWTALIDTADGRPVEYVAVDPY
jgi:hypothetical protein